MSKRNTNKLYEPFKLIGAGVCPKCLRPEMTICELDSIYMSMDEDGVPGDCMVDTNKIFVCRNCGFTTTNYVATDKGYRYSPYGYDKYIKSINRVERSPSNISGNPFINAVGEF